MNRLKLAFTVLMPACIACGTMHVTDKADFINGENTNGWTFSENQWRSPAYPVPVASFTATGTNLSDGATLTVSYSQNRFTVVRSGNATLASFSAGYVVSKLPPVAGFAITNIIDGSFTASWSPVDGAIGYRLNFYTNRLDGYSAGTELFGETFEHVGSSGSASSSIDSNDLDGWSDHRPGWSCENCGKGYNIPGVVRIGTSSKLGWASLPISQNCAGAGRVLRIVAWNYASGIGPDMPITHVSADGSTTNVVDVVALGYEREEEGLYITLPELAEGDLLVFHSTTNKAHAASKDGRINLDTVQILDGYDPGHYVLDRYAVAETTGTMFATNGMPILDGFVTLAACAANADDDSNETEPLVLDFANPPLMPILRALSISSLDNGVYEADFSVLSAFTSQGTWYNGVAPIPYWMGYNDKGEITTVIRPATTNSSYNCFFAVPLSAGPSPEYGLGFRAAKDRDGHHGIAFFNDLPVPRINIAVSCKGVQWSCRNEIPMTNTVEYLITNELVSTAANGDWKTIPGLEFTPPFTKDGFGTFERWRGETLAATLSGVKLGTGEYLIIRFTDWRSSTDKGGAGLESFRFSSERKPLASYMVIR